MPKKIGHKAGCERAKLHILLLIVSLRKISFVIKRLVQVDVSQHITVITKRNGMVLIIGYQDIQQRYTPFTRKFRRNGNTKKSEVWLYFSVLVVVHSFFIYKNVVFPAQAEYSYFFADFRLKIFLYYS